jgi:para-aminobenzoate synthetase / 4-amino-4-deoxychorismate lyase
MRQFMTEAGKEQEITPGPGPGENASRWMPLPKYIHRTVAESPGSVLLETSRFDSENERSYLFLNPLEVISASDPDEIPQVFARIEAALASGLYLAGFFSYECGYHFEGHFRHRTSLGAVPLVWLGVYENALAFDHTRGWQGEPSNILFQREAVESEQRNVPPDSATLEITEEDYCARILKIKEYIAAGDTYQVNFTDRVSFASQVSSDSLFEELSNQQPTAYSAFLNIEDHHILSFSPELFFRIDQGRIVTRPMKGTMPRGLDADDDAQAMARLRSDEKNRSEHVMIVDLLRNDLGRISTMGTIKVEDLFTVERYKTLLQMTSTISGRLRPDIRYYEIFRSLFPSGSVTGAPKIRTMQIIRELETKRRGIYTGAIGFMSPDGSAVFNVAIRTLVMRNGRAQMGVGGGIVTDSDPESEYRECLLKASFLSRTDRDFQLIETMLWDGAFRSLSMHLDRMEASAAYFDFVFDRREIASQLGEVSESFQPGRRYRVRLLLSSHGKIVAESQEYRPERWIGSIKVSEKRTSSGDPFFRHKTTRREMYDREYAEARTNGFDEVLFMNERDEITEGAISNVFIKQAGKIYTPPLGCGVLPGIFRRVLLEKCRYAEEKVLKISDLKSADAVFLCNSVRGVRRVRTLRLPRDW